MWKNTIIVQGKLVSSITHAIKQASLKIISKPFRPAFASCGLFPSWWAWTRTMNFRCTVAGSSGSINFIQQSSFPSYQCGKSLWNFVQTLLFHTFLSRFLTPWRALFANGASLRAFRLCLLFFFEERYFTLRRRHGPWLMLIENDGSSYHRLKAWHKSWYLSLH